MGASPSQTATSPPRTTTSPPRTTTSPPANGGNCTNRGATRRRHAVARLLMLQNPPPLPEQSQVAAPMSARARPRHPLTRSRGSHTQARDAAFAGTRHTPPTKTSTFPRDKAEKSPSQQHDLSILIVGSNQLKHRLSRARKPKSHSSSNMKCPITRASRINMMKSRYKTNTFCPITLKLAPTNFNTDFSAPESPKVTLPATRSVL